MKASALAEDAALLFAGMERALDEANCFPIDSLAESQKALQIALSHLQELKHLVSDSHYKACKADAG